MESQTIVSIISTSVAAVAAVISWLTYKSQKKTQENTRMLVGSKDALRMYLNELLYSLLKIESFLFVSINILKKTNYGAKLSGTLFAGLKFDLSPFNNNLFYENAALYSDLNALKASLININDLCDALIFEQNQTNMTEAKFDCYLNSIIANLKNAYFCWYQLSLHYTPVYVIKSSNNLQQEALSKATNEVNNLIVRTLEDYIKRMPEDIENKVKHFEGIFTKFDYVILEQINDEDLKQKVNDLLYNIFLAHYLSQKDFYYIEN